MVQAYGGTKPVPFQRAILQSPGWEPINSAYSQESMLNVLLKYANVTSVNALRALDTVSLQRANLLQIAHSIYGRFVYTPVPDGDFVPNLPTRLLAQGKFAKNVQVMVGGNANDGLLFTDPFVQNNTDFEDIFGNFLAGMQEGARRYISDVLYPPPPVNKPGLQYTTQVQRLASMNADSVFFCNGYAILKAFAGNGYSYRFNVPNGIHGQDNQYTFYDGGAKPEYGLQVPFNASVAYAMQDYFTQFAKTGNPNSGAYAGKPPFFPTWGNTSTAQYLNISFIAPGTDPVDNDRCRWWVKGLYI